MGNMKWEKNKEIKCKRKGIYIKLKYHYFRATTLSFN